MRRSGWRIEGPGRDQLVGGAPQGPGHKIAKTTPCKVEWAPARDGCRACTSWPCRRNKGVHGRDTLSTLALRRVFGAGPLEPWRRRKPARTKNESFRAKPLIFRHFADFRPVAGRLDRAARPDYKPALPGLRPGRAQVAQLVEHATENRSVGGSIPPLGTRLRFCALDYDFGRLRAALARLN